MNPRRTVLAVLAIASTACTTLGNRPSVVSDRPDFTESTELIAPGHVQVESGVTVSEESDVRSTSVGEMFVRVGLTDRLELRLVPSSYVVVKAPGLPSVSGNDDPTLGVKLGFLGATEEPSWRPALSMIVGSTLPLGVREFRAPRLQPEAKLLASWTINDRVAFASNLNYARPYDGTRSIGEYSASGSFAFSLAPRVGFYTEGFAFAPRDGSGDIRKYANVGSTLLLSPDLQLDARVGMGPSTKTGDYFVGVGVVRRW